MKLLRLAAGAVFLLSAILPGHGAVTLFQRAILPTLKAGPRNHVYSTIIFGGFQFSGSTIYVPVGILTLLTVLLAVVGLFLVFWPEESSNNKGCIAAERSGASNYSLYCSTRR